MKIHWKHLENVDHQPLCVGRLESKLKQWKLEKKKKKINESQDFSFDTGLPSGHYPAASVCYIRPLMLLENDCFSHKLVLGWKICICKYHHWEMLMKATYVQLTDELVLHSFQQGLMGIFRLHGSGAFPCQHGANQMLSTTCRRHTVTTKYIKPTHLHSFNKCSRHLQGVLLLTAFWHLNEAFLLHHWLTVRG